MNDTQALLDLLSMLLLDPRTGPLLALLALAAVIDWRTLRIPNWLTASGALLGLAINAHLAAHAATGLAHAAGGFATGLALLLPFHLLRVLGAGDVKLMAMAGAFLGPWSVLSALLDVLMAGGVLALAVAIRLGALRQLLGNVRFLAWCFVSPTTAGQRLSLASAVPSVGRMPFGAAICAGLAAYLVVRQFGFA